MTKKTINVIKNIKALEAKGKKVQKQAEKNADDLVDFIDKSKFGKEFNEFNPDKLAESDLNVEHSKAKDVLYKAAKKTMDLVDDLTDPDDLLGYDGQIMPIEEANKVFDDFDDDPDCAEADSDNIKFLESTLSPIVVMVGGGDVKDVDWDDINIELNVLKKSQKN